MSVIRRVLLLLVLFLTLHGVVNACGCPRISTVLDDYEQADLVIVAQLKSVTKATEPTRFLSDISHVTMVVQKVFKGEVKIGEELTFRQGEPTLDCSWQFYANQIGERYLLYLYRPENPAEPFVVSTCNRSTGLEHANDDLLYLENIDKVRGRTRISGVIERDWAGDDGEEGQQVRITGKNKSYIATTDKNGVYELYDLPPGRYSVEPVLKSGWKVDDFYVTRQPTRAEWRRSNLNLPLPAKVWFTLRAKKHFGVDIRLRLNNRIAGRVTTAAGEPLNRVCVSLAATNDTSLACNDLTEADGTFRIESVEAGSYKLLINHEDIKSSYHRFPRLYYPGVANSESAKVFTVKFGESIQGVHFVVPTLHETVKFEGTVRYSNGRPASNRFVGFNTTKTADVDGSINTTTDKHGRFSLIVLKGLRGELSSSYPPDRHEFTNCPQLQKASRRSGKQSVTFKTPHLDVEANENKTFQLRLPVSPCR